MSKSKKITIFDARSKLAAQGNKFKGGGYEDVDNYENASIQFCDVENIHAVRENYEKYTNVGYSGKFNN